METWEMCMNFSVNMERPKHATRAHFWSQKKFETKEEKLRVMRIWELCMILSVNMERPKHTRETHL